MLSEEPGPRALVARLCRLHVSCPRVAGPRDGPARGRPLQPKAVPGGSGGKAPPADVGVGPAQALDSPSPSGKSLTSRGTRTLPAEPLAGAAAIWTGSWEELALGGRESGCGSAPAPSLGVGFPELQALPIRAEPLAVTPASLAEQGAGGACPGMLIAFLASPTAMAPGWGPGSPGKRPPLPPHPPACLALHTETRAHRLPPASPREPPSQ